MADLWPKHWTRKKLGEIADVNWGDTSVTKASYVATGYPAYSASGPDGFLPYADYNRTGIVLSAIGAECGRTWLVKGKWSCIKNTIRFWSIHPDVDTEFLYWLTCNPAIWPKRGSAQPFISQSDARNLIVAYPPIQEQRAIAHILGTLDDKIELNRKMNETLEQMARAIFKSWFIDFEPVRAKMKGRWKKGQSLPGLPAHLYDLFPNELETSELGKVPKGWKIIRLGDILSEIVTGSRPKGGATEKGLPSLGAENVIGLGKYDFTKDKFIPRSYFEQLKQKGAIIKDGDILLYKDGAQIGRKSYFDHGFPHSECAVNEHVFILRSKYPFLQRYLFFWLDQPWMTSEIINLNSNSAQPGINQAGIIQLSILFPSEVIIKSFDQIIEPIITHIFSNCHETQKLTALRDTILPKLIHREIHIKDAEKFLQKEGL